MHKEKERDMPSIANNIPGSNRPLMGLTRAGWSIFIVFIGALLLVLVTVLGIVVSVGGQETCPSGPIRNNSERYAKN